MPVQQAFEYLNTMMIKGRFDHKLCIENEGLVPFDTFCEMNETFLKNGFTEWFIYGNATKDEAEKICDAGKEELKLGEISLTEIMHQLPLKLRENQNIVL